jgi:predicted metalloprotease with PDZ domain
VARGALYATLVDARLRAKSKGKRSLVDVLRGLFTKAREARGPLPVAAWMEAVNAELGGGEEAAFAKAVSAGKLDDLPDDALGPCFHKAARDYQGYDLGFDEDATRASADRKVVGLRPGGPAERAGLRAGDVLEDAVIGRGRGDVPVTLTVDRGGDRKTIKYLPAGSRAKGVGFTRKPDVPDEACAK